jgi:hypothetical protein
MKKIIKFAHKIVIKIQVRIMGRQVQQFSHIRDTYFGALIYTQIS